MAAPIEVRRDLSSDELRGFARTSKDAGQVRRLLALAAILDGGSRSEAARIAGVTLQIVRDWVLRFNEAGISGLATRKAPGEDDKKEVSNENFEDEKVKSAVKTDFILSFEIIVISLSLDRKSVV